MQRMMLWAGMGLALVAGQACAAVPSTPLAAAAAANDAVAVRRLVAAGHAPDEPEGGRESFSHRLTPLMWAARHGATEAMTTLLDAGAAVDARGVRNQWTPLQHAIHTRQAG